MPPPGRQLMGIGASEHRTFVRAKARFAGQKAQEHSFVRRNAVTPDILPCIVGGIFWRKVPRVPCPSRRPSVRPARSHSLPVERLLPGPLRPPSLPGVSLFRCFRCYLGRPHALQGLLRLPPLPGVSRFRLLTDRRPRNFAWQMVAGSDRGRDGALAQRLRARGHAPATPTTRP